MGLARGLGLWCQQVRPFHLDRPPVGAELQGHCQLTGGGPPRLCVAHPETSSACPGALLSPCPGIPTAHLGAEDIICLSLHERSILSSLDRPLCDIERFARAPLSLKHMQKFIPACQSILGCF